jgi:hypothetical protein
MSQSNNEFPVNPFIALFVAILFLAAVIFTIYERDHSLPESTLKAEHIQE